MSNSSKLMGQLLGAFPKNQPSALPQQSTPSVIKDSKSSQVTFGELQSIHSLFAKGLKTFAGVRSLRPNDEDLKKGENYYQKCFDVTKFGDGHNLDVPKELSQDNDETDTLSSPMRP